MFRKTDGGIDRSQSLFLYRETQRGEGHEWINANV
ncbi:hypothetical protein SAMN05661091_4724 [Paenibacillus uliginis N3/975]|uniref:Uncharacterized protein n=1 Tax=Paenibacillus uliginis N3/975 TaxID=1313296 RepID=A0A1X7HMW0_9BACL|nr:hypothetical protein SAMN05661091_4724 [Paenibacillus uliginis N3/975]